MADEASDREVFDYAEIPNFPTTSVEGHEGKLVYGVLGGKRVLAMQGRFHYYEGWSFEQLTFPLRVYSLLGIETLVVTNSAGGINPDYRPGHLMLIRDHINLMGSNPLRGPNLEEFGTRFPDMSEAYDRGLRRLALECAEEMSFHLHIGVYSGMPGPSYETPAEIRMLRRLGADAVGMSTVPEVIVANHCGMRVLGISCITNMAAGMTEEKLSHDEVEENASKARGRFISLVQAILDRME
jgi:purine-nucleoside phosphorylase